MAVSSALSCSAVACSLSAGPSRPFFAQGHGQQCCALKTVKMVSDYPSWGRAKLTVGSGRAKRTTTVVAAAAVKEGVAVDVNAPPSVLVETLLSLVRPLLSNLAA